MGEILKTGHTAFGGYLHQERGEDRLAAGRIGDRFLYLTIADGVSLIEDQKGKIRSGLGGKAAEEAVQRSARILDRNLSETKSIEDVLDLLHRLPTTISQFIEQGATTLQVALLGEIKDKLYWFHTFVGDGFAWLQNPERRSFGSVIVADFLLDHPHTSNVPSLARNHVNIAPSVGLRIYEPGDMLFMSSDGFNFDSMNRWSIKEHKQTLEFYLAHRIREPFELFNQLKGASEHNGDDTVFGYIY